MILKIYTTVIIASIGLYACKKTAFLNTRPDNALVVPASISDYQALLDNDIDINGAGNNGIVPALGEAGADDHYITDDYYNSGAVSAQERNEYIWAQDPYPGVGLEDWAWPYRAVFYANVALDGLTKIPVTNSNSAALDNAKGNALFIRAFNFYQLAQVFTPPYDSETAKTYFGIPLRLSPDINEKIQRATVQQTYDQITSDLKNAVQLLPQEALYVTRPSKSAAYALLSRIYLVMQDYDKALLYADSSLQLQGSLLDYNTLNTNVNYPIARSNVENMFNCTLIRNVPVLLAFVDTLLYQTYQPNDLRKNIYFKPSGKIMRFHGSYDGTGNLYSGIATDEVYLIRAECYARKGDTQAAMNDLNTLLEKRWKTGTFFPLTASDPDQALAIILTERRKELLFRGIRWTDLRRLNKDPKFAKTLTRTVGGQTYILPPNDPRYTYLIPDDVLSFNPGMPQNVR